MSNNGFMVNTAVIKDLRLKKKLSQEELSEQSLESKCYISISTIKRAELGKPISRQTLYKFAKFFEVTEENLVLQSHDHAPCDVNSDEYKYIAFLFADLYQMLVLRDANKI